MFTNKKTSKTDTFATKKDLGLIEERIDEIENRQHFIVVDELPNAEEADKKAIYLKLSESPETGNTYDEFAVVKAAEGEEFEWEQVGSTAVKLDDVLKYETLTPTDDAPATAKFVSEDENGTTSTLYLIPSKVTLADGKNKSVLLLSLENTKEDA